MKIGHNGQRYVSRSLVALLVMLVLLFKSVLSNKQFSGLNIPHVELNPASRSGLLAKLQFLVI